MEISQSYHTVCPRSLPKVRFYAEEVLQQVGQLWGRTSLEGCPVRLIVIMLMLQVAVILAGHPALIEGFAALVPGMEQRIWPDVQPAEEPAMPEERSASPSCMANEILTHACSSFP